MKSAAFIVAIFVVGFMCGVVAFGLFAIAASEPLSPAAKNPTFYRSACYRSMT